jgi:flagellar hook capping protein FlgD
MAVSLIRSAGRRREDRAMFLRRAVSFAPLFLVLAVVPPAVGAPPTPSGFVVNPPSSCGTIVLTWSAVAGADGYDITRNGDPIARIGPLITKFIDTNAMNPMLYAYCISAFDASGSSPTSCASTTQVASDLSVDQADWFQDAFPTNGDPSLLASPATFDSTTAAVETDHNLAPCGGAQPRAVIPGDYCYINTPATVDRVDLVFRIFPGPCNYHTCGLVTSGLRRIPSAPANGISVPGDGSFWGAYMAAPGLFSTPGAVAKHAAAPSGWSRDVWNSAQCELAAAGLYRTSLFGSGGVSIFPNRLFTPGAHVEYFFRVHRMNGTVSLFPDTNCVTPISTDHGPQHRWQAFSILPDRWKAAAYGGLGTPCALVVDLSTGTREQQYWCEIADSIGATRPSKYGASTGWHTVGFVAGEAPVDPNDPANNVNSGGPGFVAANLGAPGTSWDLYRVNKAYDNCIGNAGALGGRYGNVPAGQFVPGPTKEMLETFYRIVVLLTGDRDAQILGPIFDRSQNDVNVLTAFATTSPPGSPRVVIAQGGGFAESENGPFSIGVMGVALGPTSYRVASGTTGSEVRLPLFSPLTCTDDRYSLLSASSLPDNVLLLAQPECQVTAVYGNVASGDPAAIYKPVVAAHPWEALTEAWALSQLHGWDGASSYGRLAYYYCLLRDLFDPVCSIEGVPPSTTDVPPSVAAGADLLRVRNNPLVTGSARIEFEVTTPEPVRLQVLDLAGRVVRTLVNRTFEPGAVSVSWDGLDDRGRAAPRGLYVARLVSATRSVTLSRKIAVLK